MTNAWGFDLLAACSGFLFALTTASQFIENGRYKKVLVVGVDKIAENESDPNLRHQLFVALTRSRGWACMSGIGDYAFYHEINQVIKSGDTFTFTYKKPPKINTGEEIES